MMGLDQGGGREGRGEQRADFEYFEVLLLKGWVWRKAAPSPLPGAQVLCWWGKEREVPGGRGWARRGWPAGATPPPAPTPYGSSSSTPSPCDSYRQRRGSGS